MENSKAIIRYAFTFLLVTLGFIFASCDVLAPGLGEEIDIEIPAVGIESHSNGDYVGGSISLEGYANDDGGIKSVTISDGSEDFTAEFSQGQWVLDFDTTPYTDGEYEITITATDTTEKTVSTSIFLIVDNSPPSVLVTTPNDYGTDQEFNKYVTIKGEAADTTRVDKVFISLYRSSNGSAVFEDQLATGASSWYYIFDSEAYGLTVAEDFYFFVKAIDPSGNANSYFYHFEDILSIAADLSKTPNIEEINGADYRGVPVPATVITSPLDSIRKTTSSGKRMEININPDSDKPQFSIISPTEGSLDPADNTFSSPISLYGTVQDDDLAGIDESTLTLTIYDYPAASTPLFGTPIVYDGIDPSFTLSGNQWTYTTAIDDGEYYVRLEVDDHSDPASHGQSSLVPFTVSSFAPVVTITNPTQGSFVSDNGSVTITADVTNLNASGEVWLDWDNDGVYEIQLIETVPDTTWSITLTEGSTVGAGAEVFTITTDGDFTAKVRAGVSGNYGNASVRLVGDTALPVGTIDYPSNGGTVNGEITVRGVADDTMKDTVTGYLETVYYHIGSTPSSPSFPGDFTDLGQTYNWNTAVNTVALTDGSYTVTIIVEDAAGNISLPVTRDFTVDQASDVPILTVSNITDGADAIDNYLAKDPTVYGKAEDDDSIVYTSIEASVDGGAWTAVSTTDPASNSKNIDWSHNLTGITQGVHEISIQVEDENGKTGSIGPIQFTVDYGPPDLSIDSPANGSIFRENFTITGDSSDANGLSLLKIIFNGTDEYIIFEDSTAPYETDELIDWSRTFDLAADSFTDGDYTYQVVAVDGSGGTTTLDRQLSVDATVPTITFEQPPDLATVNGTSVEIRGTANDNRGLSKVYISIDQLGNDPDADITTWDTVDSGLYSWSHTIDSTLLSNQYYVISVAALDTAGNKTAYDAYQRTIKVDQESDRPIITFNDIDKDETVASNNVLVGATTLTGVIEDDDMIDPSLFGGNAIEIWIDADPWIPVSDPPASSGKLVVWRHDISGLIEGEHKVKVRARDNLSDGTFDAGQYNWAIEDSSDDSGVPFILNIGPPTVSVTSPLPYSYHFTDVLISGTATDANGVASVHISFDNGSSWTPLAITPDTSVNWDYTLSVNVDGSDDDTYSYLVRCTDDYGSVAIENGQFTVDSTKPTNVINQPATGAVVNGDMTISGTSGDNISLSEVYYHIEPESIVPEPVFPDDYTLLSGTYAWDAIIDTTLLGDVLHTLRIGSMDVAGNSSDIDELNFTVDQSSDIPVFGYTNVDADNDTLPEASGNLLETGAKIIGTVTDDDSVDHTTIEVTVYNSDDSVRTATTAISNPPASAGSFVNWSHDLSTLPDGIYYAIFSVDDNNGVTGTTDPVYFTVDLSPADLDITSPVSGSFHSADFNITGTASDPNGLLGGEIEVHDGTSWNYVAVTAGSWSFPVSAPGNHSNDGAKTYQIRATDSFGKSTTETLDFTIDTNAPTLTVNSPVDALWTNGFSLALDGTSSDSNGVVSIEVSTDNSTWTAVTGTVTWNGLLDISSLGEQIDKTLYFRSTDIAGNETVQTVDINIDRTAPSLSETTVNTSSPQYRTTDYSLNGTLSDNLTGSLPTYDDDADGGTAEVEYIEISINSAAPVNVPVNAGSWDYPVTYSGGTFNYELSITDRAGNSSSFLYRTLVEDNAAPSIDSITSPTGAEPYISGSAFSISGTASDSGDAGLDTVYWWTGDQGASAPSTASPYTGWNSSVGTVSWSGSLDLTAIGEGDKTLHIFSVDKAGIVSGVSTVDFTVDQAAPAIVEDGLGGSNITSNTDITLEITITETNGLVHGDLLDGAPVEDVDYFELMLNGADWATDAVRIEYSGTDMAHTIAAADLSEGNNEILMRATDLAGRVSNEVKRDVFFDNTAPAVSFINVNASSVVNGETFTVQGTTTDASSTISSVTIAVNGPEDAGYGADQPVSGSVYSWNYDIDLTPSGVYYSDNPISIRVTAVDSVGNTTVEELTFNINQLNDMPTLSLSGLAEFSQMANAMVTADDYVLSGVLFDGDGVDLDSLVVTFDSVVRNPRVISGNDNDSAITWYVDLSDKVSGTYNYTVTANDSLANPVAGNFSGMIDTDIPVLGSNGKITGSAEDDDAFDASSLILLQNGADMSGSVSIGADSTYIPWSYTLPASDDLYYYEINGADASVSAIPVDWAKYSGETVKTMIIKDSGSPVVTIASPSQGAYLNGSVFTSGEAYDDLAINSLTITAVQSDNVTSVELTSDPGVALDTTEGSGEYYYDTTAGKYVWDFALERLPDAYENDSITLRYEAEDIVGNTTLRERTVTIDTVDPVINIQYPSDGALVTGEVTIQGTTVDERIDTVEIRRGLTGTWETLPGTYNWNYTFNSVAAAIISDSTDNGDGTYNYPVDLRATDAAGNRTTTSAYSFNISPDMDKPVVSVTTPADNSTLGGAILIIGTATDNEAVDAVYARIDINGDGDYDDSFDLDGANGTNDQFERESTWYEITDFQSSVWKLQINTNGYLYRSNPQITGTPENFIHIQFMAEDIEGAQSIELTRTITLDETFPEITNFGLNGGGSDISGNINLVADIVDNEDITNVDISYDGGLSYESVFAGAQSTYTLNLNKDSEATIGSGGLGLADSSAIVKVRLKVTDNTGYQSFSNLELNVDNIAPTGSYTGKVDDIGTPGGTGGPDVVTISGTAKDSGIVSSFDRVEVYIVQEGNVITPQTGATSGTTTYDFGDGNGAVTYPSNSSDFIIINDTTEQGLIDNDGDGFIEDISYASGETSWATWFDTGNIDNNQAVEVHYVIYDKAGNASHYVEIMLIVGSDLDNDGTVEASERIAYPQAFQARRGLLYFELFGGSKTGFNIEVDDNLGNSTISTTAPTTEVTIDTSSVANYPEGEAIFTIRVYEGVDLKITKNISVDIKGADTNPPVLTMSPLTQSSVIDGHLDQGNAGNGPDYDISGTVRFEGSVTDDTMVQDIVLTVEGETPVVLAEWDAGLFVAKNGAVITSQVLDWKDGHSVSFSYDWDSAAITTVANLDIDVTFTARDYSNPSVNDVETYDVVPYISSVVRTGFNTNRSKLGFYPLRRGETDVKINGFNLRAGGAGDSVSIGATSTTNSSVSGVITTNVPATATSGQLTVVVNSVTAINNLNSNASSYNKENNPYVDGTDLWTDDRYIHVWQSDDNQTGGNRGYFTGSQDPIHPAMTIDGTGVLYASWSNYSLADVLLNTNDNDNTTQIFSSYDPAEHTDISIGSQISVIYNANTYGNQNWNAAGAGGVELWRPGLRYFMEELYHDQMLMQFINQRVKTVGNISHVSYYDTDTKALKYDRKDLTTGTTAEQATWISVDGGYDADEGFPFTNVVCANYDWWNLPTVSSINVAEGDVVTNGQLLMTLSNSDTITATTAGTVSKVFVTVGEEVDSDNVVQIADFSGTGRVVEMGNAVRSEAAGEYSAVDVTPTTNFPVIAYYDIENQKLKLAYSNNTNPDESNWSLQDVTADGSYTGKYVSMRIDDSGFVHITYYKTSTGDLCYIKSSNSPTDGNTAYTFDSEVIIDSAGSVGMWADLSLNGTIPVISYLDVSKVNSFDGLKIATIETGFDTNYDGTVDAADEIWETQNIPLAYEVDSKRTSIEYDTGTNFWDKAIGYASSDYYRITYYVPE